MPPELRAAASGPGVLECAEGVSVRQTVDALKIPRASVRHGAKLLVGAFVLLEARLMVSVGKRVWVDTVLRPAAADSPLTFTGDGIAIDFDVADMVTDGYGRVQVQVRHPLSDDVLARLPARSCDLAAEGLSPRSLDGWKGTWSR